MTVMGLGFSDNAASAHFPCHPNWRPGIMLTDGGSRPPRPHVDHIARRPFEIHRQYNPFSIKPIVHRPVTVYVALHRNRQVESVTSDFPRRLRFQTDCRPSAPSVTNSVTNVMRSQSSKQHHPPLHSPGERSYWLAVTVTRRGNVAEVHHEDAVINNGIRNGIIHQRSSPHCPRSR